MPGRVSETYLRPADSAASFGSMIVCTSAAESYTGVLFLPGMKNLFGIFKFQAAAYLGVKLTEEEKPAAAGLSLPWGSRAKLEFDPKLGAFTLAKPLLAGLTYPR